MKRTYYSLQRNVDDDTSFCENRLSFSALCAEICKSRSQWLLRLSCHHTHQQQSYQFSTWIPSHRFRKCHVEKHILVSILHIRVYITFHPCQVAVLVYPSACDKILLGTLCITSTMKAFLFTSHPFITIVCCLSLFVCSLLNPIETVCNIFGRFWRIPNPTHLCIFATHKHSIILIDWAVRRTYLHVQNATSKPMSSLVTL